jgi:hypothetical protein
MHCGIIIFRVSGIVEWLRTHPAGIDFQKGPKADPLQAQVTTLSLDLWARLRFYGELRT